jgi:hypothetical protein
MLQEGVRARCGPDREGTARLAITRRRSGQLAAGRRQREERQVAGRPSGPCVDRREAHAARRLDKVRWARADPIKGRQAMIAYIGSEEISH